MKIWPRDSFEIETPMTLDEAVAALDSQVEPPKFLPIGCKKPFHGTFSSDGFKITQLNHNINPFIPVIRGKFLSGPSGINIAIDLRLNPLIVTLMFVWLGILFLFIIKMFPTLFNEQTNLFGSFFILVCMLFGFLFFIWTSFFGSFWFATRAIRHACVEIFKGKLKNGCSYQKY